MKKKLLIQALIKFFCGAILVGLLIFLSAGTIDFWNGWLFIGLLFIPMFIAGLIMFFKSPVSFSACLSLIEKLDNCAKCLMVSQLTSIS